MDLTARRITAEEWRALVDADPVLQIMERINASAVARPDWSENYAYAYYRAACEEHGRYVVEKHGPVIIEAKA